MEICFKVFCFKHCLESYLEALNEQYQFLLPLLKSCRPMCTTCCNI